MSYPVILIEETDGAARRYYGEAIQKTQMHPERSIVGVATRPHGVSFPSLDDEDKFRESVERLADEVRWFGEAIEESEQRRIPRL